MKTFGDLSIGLGDGPPDEFGRVAESVATGGWARDRLTNAEWEREGHRIRFTFALTGHPTLPPAYLFVA